MLNTPKRSSNGLRPSAKLVHIGNNMMSSLVNEFQYFSGRVMFRHFFDETLGAIKMWVTRDPWGNINQNIKYTPFVQNIIKTLKPHVRAISYLRTDPLKSTKVGQPTDAFPTPYEVKRKNEITPRVSFKYDKLLSIMVQGSLGTEYLVNYQSNNWLSSDNSTTVSWSGKKVQINDNPPVELITFGRLKAAMFDGGSTILAIETDNSQVNFQVKIYNLDGTRRHEFTSEGVDVGVMLPVTIAYFVNIIKFRSNGKGFYYLDKDSNNELVLREWSFVDGDIFYQLRTTRDLYTFKTQFVPETAETGDVIYEVPTSISEHMGVVSVTIEEAFYQKNTITPPATITVPVTYFLQANPTDTNTVDAIYPEDASTDVTTNSGRSSVVVIYFKPNGTRVSERKLEFTSGGTFSTTSAYNFSIDYTRPANSLNNKAYSTILVSNGSTSGASSQYRHLYTISLPPVDVGGGVLETKSISIVAKGTSTSSSTSSIKSTYTFWDNGFGPAGTGTFEETINETLSSTADSTSNNQVLLISGSTVTELVPNGVSLSNPQIAYDGRYIVVPHSVGNTPHKTLVIDAITLEHRFYPDRIDLFQERNQNAGIFAEYYPLFLTPDTISLLP